MIELRIIYFHSIGATGYTKPLWAMLMCNSALTVLILVFAILLYDNGQAQDSTGQNIQFRIKNESKFLISKLIILGRNFEKIRSGQTTDYVTTAPFYPSLQVDITLERKPTFGKYQWYHSIMYPIDNVDETRITNKRSTIEIKVSRGKEKGQIEVDIEIIED